MLKKVQSGQPLRIPAATFNAMVDAARANRERLHDKEAQPASPSQRGADVLYVRNDSGTDLDRFAALGIDGILIGPADNADEFKREPALVGVTPTIADHSGRFVVLKEPIKAGRIGLAVVSGFTVATLHVTDEVHGYAEVQDASTVLVSANGGTAEVLWKEPGTGDKLGLIRFLGGASQKFYATITGSTQVSPNRWAYNWEEAKHAEAGTFAPLPLGRASTTLGVAYNTLEANNSGSGVEGSGDNFGTLPAGLMLLPIGVGAVVEIDLHRNCNGVVEPLFTHPNNVGGTC